jgi:hypothetical protein
VLLLSLSILLVVSVDRIFALFFPKEYLPSWIFWHFRF